ncbi:MAG: AAA family ATPase [Candidatus Njordarchaeota archaeon]
MSDLTKMYFTAIKNIAKYYSISSENLEFLASAMLTRNPKILLIAPPESGKTTLVNVIAKLFKNAKIGIIISHPRKTVEQTLVRLKIEDLLTKNQFTIELTDFINAEIKFINEINRLNPEVWDALLSVLEEGYLEFYGKIYNANKEYICFADMNPYRGDIDIALKTRFDYSLYLSTIIYNHTETMRITKLLLKKQKITDYIESVIDFNDLIKLRNEVEKINIHDDIIVLADLIVLGLFGCKHVDKNYIENPILNCEDCVFSQNYCRFIKHTSGFRTIRSAIQLIRARSFLRQRDPKPEDIIFALKYSIPHRVELLDNYKTVYYNIQKFVSDYLAIVESKLDIRVKFVKAIIKRNIDEILSIKSKETDIGIDIIAERVVNIDSIKESISNLILKLQNENKFTVKDFDRLSVEKANLEKTSPTMFKEIIEQADKILNDCVIQIPVNTFREKLSIIGDKLDIKQKILETIANSIGYVYEPQNKKYRILRGANNITILAYKGIIDALRRELGVKA